MKEDADSDQALYFTSKSSRWLEDVHLVENGNETNWKRQYKLRDNWTKGTCAVNEIEVAEEAPIPPVLVQMHNGVIYMADLTDGLRAWSAQGERKMVARTLFDISRKSSPPTSLGVDSDGEDKTQARIIVGYEDGHFSIYLLETQRAHFTHIYTHQPSINGVVSAVALSWPYAVTMTATQHMSLYAFPASNGRAGMRKSDPPRLLHSLKSHTVWPPLATSLKVTSSNITISVAYTLPTYLSGWTVGIQEVRVSPSGELLESRLASAIDQHYRPLAFTLPPIVNHLPTVIAVSPATSNNLELRHIHSKPTSLSYSHPYLLVSHPDNTLTLYLVTSTKDSLSISPGCRLWGHTSSVSGAQVGGRGKAVSVSRRGDELRVWELEGGFASSTARKRLASGELSVRIRPETPRERRKSNPEAGLHLVSKALTVRNPAGSCATEASELTLTRGWVGFDEENVVVLREHSQGRQALVIYDFT